ncbi:F-box domain-containing protein [Psidium guajava]|nr:F-box domain-containing protein [Psidium guajava]
MEKTVPWSDLPKEMWWKIARRLDTPTDLRRFRSVCSSWRSLIPPIPHHDNPPLFPLKLPLGPSQKHAFLSQSTLYRLQPPGESGPAVGWLVKLEESGEPGCRLRLLSPLSKQPINYKPGTFPNVLNTLDFRVTEIGKEYAVEVDEGVNLRCVAKVALFPDSAWADAGECAVVGILEGGKLGHWRYGDEGWSVIEGQGCHFDDVMVYKGQFYAVDRLGTVSWIDPSFQVVQFSPPMCGGGDRKHLVESGGDLYVVDRYLDEVTRYRNNREVGFEVVRFRVYRLDQEWGKWDEVRRLDGVALFLGDHSCFSVSVEEFGGCVGNCIYFTELNDSCGAKVHVFCMEDQSIKRAVFLPDYFRILWPPPAWISPGPCPLDPHARMPVF